MTDDRDGPESSPTETGVGSSSGDDLLRAIAAAPEREVPREPARIGQFRILGRLGQGGMGIVYRAEDEVLHRVVALKVLPFGFEQDADRRRRFLREARSAAAVTHPNIAVVHEVGESEGRIYIAMELASGETLRVRLAKGPLTVEDALAIARQLARGLARAHKAGIVHRDLKPDNIVVDSEGHVKILDFGLAKFRIDRGVSPSALGQLETETRDGLVMGTPAYMSPEQARGKDVAGASDVFAFGVILYEMLAGRRPFVGESLGELLIAIDRGEPESLIGARADLSPEISDVVMRCLAKSAGDRYADGEALVQALAALGESTPSRGITEPPQAGVARRSMRWRSLGALAVLALGVAVAEMAWPKSHVVPVLATASASASAPARTLTNGAPPTTSNAAAAALYTGALQKLHDGDTVTGTQDLRSAVKLDPTMVVAYLAILCFSDDRQLDDAVANAQRVNAMRARLDERDRALLALCEKQLPVVTPSAEAPPVIARATAIAERFPNDAVILAIAGDVVFELGDPAGRAFTERAIALDPTWPGIRGSLAYSHYHDGDIEIAQQIIDRCIADIPNPTDCLQYRLWWNAGLGRCDAVEKDARTLQNLNPDSAKAAYWVARALATRGAPLDSIRDSLERARRFGAPSERFDGEDALENEMTLAMLGGDLATAEVKQRALYGKRSTATSDESLAETARLLVETAIEAGDVAVATSSAKRYLDSAPSRIDNAGTVARPYLLQELRRESLVTETDFRAQRDDIVQNARLFWSWDRSGIFFDIYASPAITPQEAKEGLAALPRFLPLPKARFYTPFPSGKRDGYAARALGTMYQLADRVDDALPLLREGTAACDMLDCPVEQIRAHVSLGRALEAKNDSTGACTAYQFVLTRWPHPKPRSLSVDTARGRVAALGCKTP